MSTASCPAKDPRRRTLLEGDGVRVSPVALHFYSVWGARSLLAANCLVRKRLWPHVQVVVSCRFARRSNAGPLHVWAVTMRIGYDAVEYGSHHHHSAPNLVVLWTALQYKVHVHERWRKPMQEVDSSIK